MSGATARSASDDLTISGHSSAIVDIDRVAITQANEPSAGTLLLDVELTLRSDGVGAPSLTLVDPEIATMERITCSAAPTIEATRRAGYRVVDLTRPAAASFDGAAVTLALRWDAGSIERTHGAPVFAVPTYLPQPMSPRGPYFDPTHPAPTAPAPLPRISAPESLIELAGTTRDEHGALLMLATPLDARFRGQIHHADDALVLGGNLVAHLGDERRRAVTQRLHAIHRFLGEELGHGDRVRALVVLDANAASYSANTPDYSALAEDRLTMRSSGTFSGERVMVLELANLWWSSGVCAAGMGRSTFAHGLSAYAVLRWFEESGRRADHSRELAFIRDLKERIEHEGVDTRLASWRAASLAHALHEAHEAGIAVTAELRRWCTDYWGMAMPLDTLIDRLVAIGVKVAW